MSIVDSYSQILLMSILCLLGANSASDKRPN
jgi:hypothetical protein